MKAIGIILAGGNSEMRLGELTNTRAASAMPVGGCYRTIDFPLSNMSNSRISKVAVITQYNSRSLNDHLTSSKWWDFGRKQGGLFVFTPYISTDNSFWFRGTADSIYQNLSFLKKSNETYVVIASGDAVYKMNYRDVIQYHKDTNADITVVYKEFNDKDLTKFGIMQLDSENRVIEFEEKPIEPQSNCASIGVYVISRTLLIELLEEVVPEGRYDIVKDVIIRFRRKLNIKAYKFDGYWSNVGGGIKDYYNTNMDFLKPEVRDIFVKQYPYTTTKPKDEPPVKYNFGADVTDTITGGGSIVNGKVNHSILFRRVYIGENAEVKNSILMEGCYIGNNCVIENAIFDKNVVISEGKHIIGEKDNPVVLKKDSVV
ncbi:MAG TPA: glucose-1-phosphate adenylyltransferase subunit GlgD [Lachnospiraceae bacterium]|nr:glucose-1-phosphate adenylyltransferase subunit GlgD [Lachnospiraceae bacterium]